MRVRCYQKDHRHYDRYGGRGIRVCRRWLGRNGFENFLADMGPRPSRYHSLERRDNDDNYSPANCLWGTREQQANNKSTNRRITHDGRTMTLSQWARHLGLKTSTLAMRLTRKSVAEAFTRPPPT